MARVNNFDYVEVKERSGKSSKNIGSWRNFWIGRKVIKLQIVLPHRFWGKRIRIKIEKVEEIKK